MPVALPRMSGRPRSTPCGSGGLLSAGKPRRQSAFIALRDNLCANLEAAAWILRDAIDSAPDDFWKGVAHYHEPHPAFPGPLSPAAPRSGDGPARAGATPSGDGRHGGGRLRADESRGPDPEEGLIVIGVLRPDSAAGAFAAWWFCRDEIITAVLALQHWMMAPAHLFTGAYRNLDHQVLTADPKQPGIGPGDLWQLAHDVGRFWRSRRALLLLTLAGSAVCRPAAGTSGISACAA